MEIPRSSFQQATARASPWLVVESLKVRHKPRYPDPSSGDRALALRRIYCGIRMPGTESAGEPRANNDRHDYARTQNNARARMVGHADLYAVPRVLL